MLHGVVNVKRQSRTSQSIDANDPPGRAAPEVSAEYESVHRGVWQREIKEFTDSGGEEALAAAGHRAET